MMQTRTSGDSGGRQAGASGVSSNVPGGFSADSSLAIGATPLPQKSASPHKSAPPNDISMTYESGNSGTTKTISGSQSIQKVGPRLRAEGNMVPPASDAATLRRQVAALQSDLEAHIDSEHHLQNINQQLRERLELYMKQNHENVEQAESELNTLHEDMEQTLELQQRLAERASCLEKEKKDLEHALKNCQQRSEVEQLSLKNQINTLSEDLKTHTDTQSRAKALEEELEIALVAKAKLKEELDGSCTEANVLKLKVERYYSELKDLVEKEKRKELLEMCFRRSLSRRCFQRLKEATKEEQHSSVAKQVAAAFCRRQRTRLGFRSLRQATHRASQIRQAQNRHDKACLQVFWRAWRLATIAQKRYQGTLRHKKRKCLSNILSKWKMAVEMGKLTSAEEIYLTGVATKHWRQYLCRCAWKCWSKWIEVFARPLKLKLQGLEQYLDKLSCMQTIAAWKCIIRMKHVKRLKMEQASMQKRSWWKKHTFMRWYDFSQAKKRQKMLLDKGLQFRKLNRRREVIRCWIKQAKLKGDMKILEGLAFRHLFKTLQLKGFTRWRHYITQQQAEARAVLELNFALKRAAMVFWRDYHVLQAIKLNGRIRSSKPLLWM